MNHKSIINLCLVSSRGPSKALLQEENINLIPVIVFSILKTNTILISVIINYYLEEARCVASLIAQDFAVVSHPIRNRGQEPVFCYTPASHKMA